MALKDCFREAARARAHSAQQSHQQSATVTCPTTADGPLSAMTASAARGAAAPSSSAAAGWARMRTSQDEADGASQHIDLTPKAHRPPPWKSSWRQGMVNGKPLPTDPSPAIEIIDLTSGERIHSGHVDGEPAAVEASAGGGGARATATAAAAATATATAGRIGTQEEAAQLDAAIRESLNDKVSVGAGATTMRGGATDGAEGAAMTDGAAAVGAAELADDVPLPHTKKAPTPAAVRVPYRANMLTRVLRNCFEDESHRTAIIAAVAPGAESVLHSLNTLDHVLLMAPHLLHHSCEVNVPMCGGDGTKRSYEGTPVHEWDAEQVIEWLATVDGGRFSQVVVPRGTEGKDLLRMNAKRLTDLVETEHEAGREDGEGWFVSAQAKVGRALFSALRVAQRQNGLRRRE